MKSVSKTLKKTVLHFPRSFGYKLMLSYCLFITIPILIGGSVTTWVYIHYAHKQATTNLSGTIQQITNNIVYKLEDTKRISDILYGDLSLKKVLNSHEDNWELYDAFNRVVMPKLEHATESANSRIWVSLYTHHPKLPEIYYNHHGMNPLNNMNQFYELYQIARIQTKDWYKQFPSEVYGETFQWKQVEDDEKFGNISFLRRIVDTTNNLQLKEFGFTRIVVKLEDLFQGIDYRTVGEGSSILIMDERGKVMYVSGEDTSYLDQAWNEEWGSKMLMIEQQLPQLNWSIRALVPNEMIENGLANVRILMIITCIFSFVVFILIGSLFSRYFSRRVVKVVSVLESFREGEFSRRVEDKGSDEFSHIIKALNEMGQNTEELINEVYITNIAKKEAELESLQAQINPHFLYNSLSSISRLAKFGQVDKLHTMVVDLAKFYRLTLNEGRTIIPISNEVMQVEAYINIQKIRYGARMEVLMDIDPEILQYDTIKLILQPFVENVLEHAWCGDHIAIRIVGTMKEEVITIKIIDDGNGMRPEVVDQIMNQGEELNVGYGIYNVNQRIKLHYGERFGVSLFSKLGIGTTVTILIPAYRERTDRQSGRSRF